MRINYLARGEIAPALLNDRRGELDAGDATER
jgi:hypothetical protein